MLEIRTILCPVDFSPITERQLLLGTDLCRLFGARLILEHNLAGMPPAGMGVRWMWEEEHEREEVREEKTSEERLRELLSSIPEEIEREGRISHGPLAGVLEQAIAEVEADLVVMGTHGVDSEEHHSATAGFLERASCPVLTLRDRAQDTAIFQAQDDETEASSVLVPLDFEDYSIGAARYAFALAARLPIRLHLLHVEPQETRHRPTTPTADASSVAGIETQLRALVPEGLVDRVSCEVSLGQTAEEILTHAEGMQAQLVIMGVHKKGFLRKLFAGAHANEILFASPCPVLYVSTRAAKHLS